MRSLNEPIRKLGLQNGKTVYYLNGEDVTLSKGLNPTRVFLGTRKNKFGEPEHVFAPTRSERRQALQTRANQAWHGKYVGRFQYAIDKDGKLKRIAHFTK